MRFYLLRHGQTLFNEKQITQGWCDSFLTELGRQQALSAGQRMSFINFSKACVSDLGRTRETFAYVSKGYGKDIPVVYSDCLREMNFGIREGEKMVPHDPEEYSFFGGYKKQGGDSLEEVQARMNDFLLPMCNDTDENVLVVSHGWSIRAFLDSIDPDKTESILALKQGKTGNCSLSVVEAKNGQLKVIDAFNNEY